MFGIIFIYFIGKYFYELAFDYDKNKWKYAIFGVLVYYAGIMVSAFIIGFIYIMVTQNENIDGATNTVLSLLSIPFGILFCYFFYKYLSNKWSKEKQVQIDEIEQIGGLQ